MHPAITVFDTTVANDLNLDVEIIKLDATCAFSEGPVWNKAGFWLFSDIPRNAIYKINEQGEKTIFLAESGCSKNNTRLLHEQIGSNGLAYDVAGNLWICQHGDGAVARWDGEHLEPVIHAYKGNVFNSPNDLVTHEDGSVIFSDPPYGLKGQVLATEKYQPFAGVYHFKNGVITCVTDCYQYPNGICLSPDHQFFYTCSNKLTEAMVLEWRINDLSFSRQLAAETADGIKCDRRGNFVLCNRDGLLILDSSGKRRALIALETVPANCNWGGENGRDLLITARQNIFLLKDFQKE